MFNSGQVLNDGLSSINATKVEDLDNACKNLRLGKECLREVWESSYLFLSSKHKKHLTLGKEREMQTHNKNDERWLPREIRIFAVVYREPYNEVYSINNPEEPLTHFERLHEICLKYFNSSLTPIKVHILEILLQFMHKKNTVGAKWGRLLKTSSDINEAYFYQFCIMSAGWGEFYSEGYCNTSLLFLDFSKSMFMECLGSIIVKLPPRRLFLTRWFLLQPFSMYCLFISELGRLDLTYNFVESIIVMALNIQKILKVTRLFKGREMELRRCRYFMTLNLIVHFKPVFWLNGKNDFKSLSRH
ncbi:hypothetical protein EGR_10454 [Echinococcus granulosus]|uniref:Uncharacterized protein n=1 Tax=Echinococcus granulosus TaxID=6210 RepID=W6U8D6_ECHGR|nr:hypothetical protein EGR_10454 [Echinococcus granulosus]EUB54692.1 hypothetical protein EGR_10454 [Echinococcus granulosus]